MRMPGHPSDALLSATAMPSDLPDLGVQLGQIQQQLTRRRQLGVLSITVLQRDGGGHEDGWDDYERVLQEITRFLSRYAERKMRHSDVLLDPIIAGNTFLIFFDRPRNDRTLDSTDIAPVRRRLKRSIDRYMARALPHSAVERFGVYVGGALVNHDPQIDSRRLVYRSLEAAFADALGQKKAEGPRGAIYVKRILDSGKLGTVFQPILDLAQRSVLGYEALTRVNVTQFQTPDLMFKAAQEHGNLWDLERLSRRRALEHLPELPQEQLLFLNMEPHSVHDPALRSNAFLEQLSRAGLDPRRVVFELTEHSAVKDFKAIRETIDEFREVGYRLAMDDVGSGYSGLQAIAEIAPDFLKIDMSLVRDLHINPIKRELIATIRRFTDTTGGTLIAEGVENGDELAALTAIGVRCAQGFFLGRPHRELREPDWATLAPFLGEPATPNR